jgi:hypothetical protein
MRVARSTNRNDRWQAFGKTVSVHTGMLVMHDEDYEEVINYSGALPLAQGIEFGD